MRHPRTEKTYTGQTKAHNLFREHVHYRYLREQGITFFPESLFYDEERGFHCISYVPGAYVRLSDLSDTLTKTLVKQLWALSRIDYQQYHRFCRAYGLDTQTNIERLTDAVEQYSAQPLVYLRQIGFDAEVVQWMEERLHRNRRLAAESVQRTANLLFTPGDIGGNLIENKGDLTFIDAELSRWIYVQNGFGYILLHGPLRDRQQFHVLADQFAAVTNQPRDVVEHDTKVEVVCVLLNDVAWAAVKTADASGDERAAYAQCLRARMEGMERLERAWQSGDHNELIDAYIWYGKHAQ